MRKALCTYSSVVFHASFFIFPTWSILCDVVSTFTRVTTVVVVLFAVFDTTVVVLKFKWSIALWTPMIWKLHFAAQKKVVSTLTVHQRIFRIAQLTWTIFAILHAFLNSNFTLSIFPSKSIGTVKTIPIHFLKASRKFNRIDSTLVD